MDAFNANPDESKEIVRIVIKSESGYGPVDEAYKDKVIITKDSIRYEYTPHLVSKTNPGRKWSYRTTSPIFQQKFDELAQLLPDALECKDYFVMDMISSRFDFASNT